MKTLLSPSAQLCSVKYDRIVYAGLLFAAIVLLFLKDWQNGFSVLGISLVAAPFNQKLSWARQPLWQRSWLIIHVVVVFVAMTYLIISKL